MKRILIIFLIFIFTCISSGFCLQKPPQGESKYLITSGAGFVVEQGASLEVFYAVLLAVKKHDFKKLYLEVKFDDPDSPGKFITQDYEINSNDKEIKLGSPAVKGLKVGTEYTVLVKVFEDNKKTKQIDELIQKVNSSIDQAYLEKMLK